MRLIPFALLVFLSACGEDSKHIDLVTEPIPNEQAKEELKDGQKDGGEEEIDLKPQVDNVDPEFEFYLAQFRYEGELRLDRRVEQAIEIQFGHTNGPVAVCFHKSIRVIVRRNYWDLINQIERELLIFHELGHCLLGINYHVDDRFSIMNSILPNASYYFDNKSTLLNDMFYNLKPMELVDFPNCSLFVSRKSLPFLK